MFDRIVVPTDFNAPSQAALEYARRLAARFGSAIRILHVVEDATARGFVGDGLALSAAEIEAEELASARLRLAHLLTPANQTACETRVDAIIGPPARTIVEYAAATGAGLIVMGTHGRKGLAHLVMGSVAEEVMRTASCPVLTVRDVAAAEAVRADDTYARVPAAIAA
jgi:nucleotide-binding universal stress UspA family protein